jgi:hypothetical protein
MKTLQHKFIDLVPGSLEEGVLYISILYRSAIHLCACGCGREVVTPISPGDWQLFFNGETVSLRPSIGNWKFDCRSHYFITHNIAYFLSQDKDQTSVIAPKKKTKRKRKRLWPAKKKG